VYAMMFEHSNDLELLGWLAIPYLYSKLAASSGWLCGVADVLSWPDQLHLELTLLLPGAWPAPPGCLPCTSWMLGLLLLDAGPAPPGCLACSSLLQLDLAK
jgi:hypothetical protein